MGEHCAQTPGAGSPCFVRTTQNDEKSCRDVGYASFRIISRFRGNVKVSLNKVAFRGRRETRGFREPFRREKKSTERRTSKAPAERGRFVGREEENIAGFRGLRRARNARFCAKKDDELVLLCLLN